MPEFFCPFCHGEVSETELKEAIEKSSVHDIEIRKSQISALLEEPKLKCKHCNKQINLGENGLIVLDETEKKLTVRIQG